VKGQESEKRAIRKIVLKADTRNAQEVIQSFRKTRKAKTK
jgi:hypothetical protein